MLTSFFGIKLDQTQAFDEKGVRIPVTIVNVMPLTITQIKNTDKEGYNSIQVAIGAKKHLKKPIEGHLKKTTLKIAPLFFRESKLNGEQTKKIGDQINISEIFQVGDKVQVTGISKGKGFAGVVKRHHFHGGPRTHGQSDRERAPGSIGSTTTPGRVYKGKRMAGRLGGKNITVKNLRVYKIDNEKNQILLKGLIPGPKKGLIKITKI